ERLFEPARAEVGKDLERLALDRGAHGRVVKQCNPLLGAQPCQRPFELHRLIDGLLHEALGRRLAPGAERAATEAAGKTLGTRYSDAVDLVSLAVENL